MKLLPALLLAAVAAPTPQIRYFRYQRPVQLPSNAFAQTCAVIDPTTFAHAAPSLADLRLYRDNAETPYLIHQASPNPAPPQTIALINPGTRAGRTVFDAAMPESSYRDLDLAVTGRDFIATITVYGGQRANAVNTRIGNFTIFDLSGQKLGRSTVLHLPQSNFPFLHFEVSGPLVPDQFQHIAYQRQASQPPRYLAVAQKVHLQQNGRNTVASFTLPANVPADRVVFAPPVAPINFSRSVEIAVTAQAPSADRSRQIPPSSWNGNILRIHRVESSQHLDEENLAIDVPFGSFSYPSQWTITIDNGDDAPIAFTAVTLQMVERDLCFEASPSAAFALYYGDPALSAPRYDYATWAPPAAAANAAAVLGPEQSNPAWQPRPDTRPFTEQHPLLLWLALILVVAILAWIALRSAKGVSNST